MQISPLFEQNMRTLREQQPRLAKLLEEAKAGYEALPEVSIIEGKNGRWIEGLAPSPFFDHAVDPTPKKKDAKKSLFMMMGAGFPPYLFRRFRALPKDVLAVVVFEPNLNVLIHTLCSTSVFRALPTGCKLAFLLSPERDYVQEVLDVNIRPLGSYIVSEAEFIVHEGEFEVFSEAFRNLHASYAAEVRVHIDTLGNSPEDTLLGFRQIALNLAWLLASPDLEKLGSPFRGKNFVCVASGPSLEKNVHLLKGQENKCVIISAETALRRLLEEGIRPHVVVTLERPTHTYTNYFKVLVEQYAEQCKDILLVGQGVSPPQVYGRWPGPKVAVGKVEVPVDRWFISGVLRGNILRSGMSVSHMAVTLASVWGAGRIALVGQDLAFSVEGESHAGATVDQSARKLERSRGLRDALEVPGIGGGLVKTTMIWLTFLKIFEVMIPDLQTMVFDCTEGGALIKGTEICSLQDYLESITEDVFFTSTPAEEMKLAGLRLSRLDEIKGVLERINSSLRQLNACSSILDEIELSIRRVVAPGLPPERRRAAAFSLSQKLDSLHALNPVLAFIGQSYANLSGVSIARSRWLETVGEIQMWEKVHLEIVQAHRVNIRYLYQWSMYAKSLCQILIEGKTWLGESVCVLYSDVSADKAVELFAGAMENMASLETLERWGKEIVSLNLLVARSDPLLESWTPELQWQLALFLHGQGRAEEASHLMRAVAVVFENKEMSVECIVSFLKDFARVVTTHDLCFVPQYRLAKLLLDNARRYAPDDSELVDMAETVLNGLNTYLEDLYTSGMIGDPASLEARRILAERALNKKDLPEALYIIWSLVKDFSSSAPESVFPLANWLFSTLDKCVHAEDIVIHSTVDNILAEMSALPAVWGELNLRIPAELFAHLQAKGLQFSLETTDTVSRD